MHMPILRRYAFLFACLLWSPLAISAEAPGLETARQTWQLLDYVAVDYAGAVATAGKIQDQGEYGEMVEFVGAASKHLAQLPASEALPELKAQVARLRELVDAKAAPDTVAQQAHGLAAALLKAYPFPVAPHQTPDLSHGQKLFEAQCAACHGAAGKADGPLAAKLEPPPTNFTDPARARARSLFALYQVATQGVKGTSMPSFRTTLSDEDRWAVAFFVGTLAYADQAGKDSSAGPAAWKAALKGGSAAGDLQTLTQVTESALATRVGPQQAAQAMTWARKHPAEAAPEPAGGIAVVKAQIADSLALARSGDKAGATRKALAAYLDGFEPLEPGLRARDATLLAQVEAAMAVYRSSLTNNGIPQAVAAEGELQALLDRVEPAMAATGDDAFVTFIAALTILLREGLEALLVVVAMIAFLRKAGRFQTLRFVHAGWVLALAAGGATWGVATWLVSISGAGREMTEGFSSLFAAVVLLGVGIWMHQKSVAGRWQLYLKQKLSAALNKRTAWLMFGLAFISVYREVFETVLFYAALWTDGNGLPLLAGLACGAVILAGVAAILLRTSARLPIGKFFAASSLLVAVLAVVLAGKGVAALQEAGVLHVSIVPFPRIDLLGVFPTAQSLLAQALVLIVAVIAFMLNVRGGRISAKAAAAAAS